MSMCECIHDKEIGLIRDIFTSIGTLLVLPEKYMNAVTALSGSGPAFFAYFVEAMIEGAIRMGLGKDDAAALAVQTSLGTARMLGTGMNPSKLKEMVTSSEGTTAAGLKVFEERGLKRLLLVQLRQQQRAQRSWGVKDRCLVEARARYHSLKHTISFNASNTIALHFVKNQCAISDNLSLLQKYFINTTYSPFQKHFSSSYGLFDSKLQTITFNSVIFVFLNPFLNISIPCYLFIKKQF